MDYLKFYDLELEPFKNDFSRDFYFESEGQRLARLRLQRGIAQKKGLSVLVGGPGCGKSTLAHRLFADLDETAWVARMIVVPHSSCGRGWLLPQLALQFGVEEPANEIPALMAQLGVRLAEICQGGRHPVLFIDEAQMLQNLRAMEELRALLNLTDRGEKLLSIVLVGLPGLADVVALDAPLAQRIEVGVELLPMRKEEASAYLEHRLECAGASSVILSPEAIDTLFRFSGGVPRSLNTLADNALFEGSLTETQQVDASIVAAAARDLGLGLAERAPRVPPAALSDDADDMDSLSFVGPPLPAPSASQVAVEAVVPAPGAPTESPPSTWETSLWDEPDADLAEPDEETGESIRLEDEADFVERSLSHHQLREPVRAEPPATLADPEFDLGDLLQLPEAETGDELAEPLEIEPDDAVFDAVEALEVSPLDDDAGFLGAEADPARAGESTGEGDGFDLGTLLTELEEDPEEDTGGLLREAEPVADAAVEEDDVESLFDAIKLNED